MARSGDPPPKGLETVFRILGKAMLAADPTTWPARVHRGGPLPVLSTRQQLDVALAIGDRVPDDAGAAQLLALARRAAATTSDDLGPGLTRDALDLAAKPSARDPASVRVAKMVVRTAARHLFSPPSARNAVGDAAAQAAVAMIHHTATLGAAAQRDFLAALDDDIIRAEAIARLADKRLEPTSPIARVISRPGTKALALVLARLADGRYGLLCKLGARWTWHEGDRATMFAMIPDEHMAGVSDDLLEFDAGEA